jgi:exodeoxyribonuclease VII large subunit
VIYPVAVQGDNAGSEIAAMVETANKRNECDVLIVTRGGGSLEDLWAFNDEILARSIFNSDIPVIAGVGHEIDFTIADFVADRRAPTPSVAAEIASPDAEELAQHVQHLATRHLSAILSRLQGYSLRLDGLLRRLRHPGQRLQMTAQRLDELEQRANQALHHRVRHTQSAINELATRLKQHTPAHTVEKFSLMGKTLEKRLLAAIHSLLRNKTQQFVSLSQALDIVSPLATLDRGYAIVMDEPGQHVLRDSSKVKKGDRLKTRLAKGQLISRVEEISD